MEHRIDELLAVQPEEHRTVGERMEYLRAKFIRMPRDRMLLQAFERLLYRALHRRDLSRPASDDNRREARGLLVVGATGAGKTRSLTRLFQEHPALPGYGVAGSGCPLVTVSVPSPATMKVLGLETLAALGYPLERDRKEWQVWDIVRHQLRERKIVALHLDEGQHLVQHKTTSEVQKLANTLKALQQAPDWPVFTILSGLPSLVRFAHFDGQFGRRQVYLRFDGVTAAAQGSTMRRIVESYIEAAGLVPVVLRSDDFMPRLVHAARAQLGLVIEIALDAIEEALYASDDALRLVHFEGAYARRTGCAPEFNVFLSSAWAAIDTGRVMTTAEDEEDHVPEPKSQKQRNSRRSKW